MIRPLRLAVAALLLAACTASEPAAETALPTGPPYLRGVVTAVEPGRVRVEENPVDESGSAKAVLTLTPATVVLWRGGDPAGTGDLRPGTHVSVWVAGPVLESYPVQATAGTVVIELVDLPVQHPA